MDEKMYLMISELLILKGRVEALKAYIEDEPYPETPKILAILGTSDGERSE